MSICVHGLGYVGLAAAAHFANNGHTVTGFDTDDAVVDRLQQGRPETDEGLLDTYVRRALSDGLTVASEPTVADYHLICVPTPYDRAREQADLTYVEQAARNAATYVRDGDTVVLESTVPPGTTAGRFARAFEQAGVVPGREINLGYSPETVLPGNTVAELQTNDRIVGGIDESSSRMIRRLYDRSTDGTVYEAPDPTTAEFVKLAQNAARDVEIAYANALALIANDYGVDVRTVITLANNHPRVDILDPGPGVGGHCLPVDPLFFEQWSDETGLIDCARETNDRMPEYVTGRLKEALGTLDGATVAVFGAAYKGNVSDTRNSPGLAIIRLLQAEQSAAVPLADGGQPNVTVRLYDPHVSDDRLDLSPLDEAVTDADAMLIAAGHDEFTRLNPERLGQLLNRRLVVDPLDLLARSRWTRSGFDVVGL